MVTVFQNDTIIQFETIQLQNGSNKTQFVEHLIEIHKIMHNVSILFRTIKNINEGNKLIPQSNLTVSLLFRL